MTCKREGCGKIAVCRLKYPNPTGDIPAYCMTDGLTALNTLTDGGVVAKLLPIEDDYESPKLTALGSLEDLVNDRTEVVKIFRDVLKHADHVVGNLIPGAVLHDGFQRMRAYLHRLDGGKALPPVIKSAPVSGEVAIPGHSLCRHGVPTEIIPCQACKAEQEAMAEEATATPVTMVPVPAPPLLVPSNGNPGQPSSTFAVGTILKDADGKAFTWDGKAWTS
jgi:hypothetical protein